MSDSPRALANAGGYGWLFADPNAEPVEIEWDYATSPTRVYTVGDRQPAPAYKFLGPEVDTWADAHVYWCGECGYCEHWNENTFYPQYRNMPTLARWLETHRPCPRNAVDHVREVGDLHARVHNAEELAR